MPTKLSVRPAHLSARHEQLEGTVFVWVQQSALDLLLDLLHALLFVTAQRGARHRRCVSATVAALLVCGLPVLTC